MSHPDAAWNKQPIERMGWWRRFGAALPMRTALIAVGVVWALGCIWSYQEQSAFAFAKGFSFPHLLPLVIDGFAVSMAGVSWAASLDARPAIPARLATVLAVGASSASNGVWAYLRANHDLVTVVLGVAVPIAANLAFEVLLAELRRQVQRRRGLPPPVAVPYPRLVRLFLAPWQTMRTWRALVLELTAMEHTVAPRVHALAQPAEEPYRSQMPDPQRSIRAGAPDPDRDRRPVRPPAPAVAPERAAPDTHSATPTFTAPSVPTRPVAPPAPLAASVSRHGPLTPVAGHGSFAAGDQLIASDQVAGPDQVANSSHPLAGAESSASPDQSGSAASFWSEFPAREYSSSRARPTADGGHAPAVTPTEIPDRDPAPSHRPPTAERPQTAADRSRPAETSTRNGTVRPVPSSVPTAERTAARPEPAAARPARTARPQPAEPAPAEAPRAASGSARQPAGPVRRPAARGTGERQPSAGEAEGNTSQRPLDPRVVQLANHLATAEDAEEITGEMVGQLLQIDVAARTGRRLLGQARELVNRRAQQDSDGFDSELSVIGGR